MGVNLDKGKKLEPSSSSSFHLSLSPRSWLRSVTHGSAEPASHFIPHQRKTFCELVLLHRSTPFRDRFATCHLSFVSRAVAMSEASSREFAPRGTPEPTCVSRGRRGLGPERGARGKIGTRVLTAIHIRVAHPRPWQRPRVLLQDKIRRSGPL